jgi:hypothetical protein
MTHTPQLDRLAADGTGPTYGRVHLADGQGIAVMTRPGAKIVTVAIVSRGVAAPKGARTARPGLDAWLTTGRLVQRHCYEGVPIDALRALIAQHGGEHADQGPSWSIPYEEGIALPDHPEGDRSEGARETAKDAMARTLADEWSITAHLNDESMIGDASNSWLVVGRDQDRQGFPDMDGAPYIVLYLYNEAEDEITVERAPTGGDAWHLVVGDGTGSEFTYLTHPADDVRACAEDVAPLLTLPLDSWVTAPAAESIEVPVGDGFHDYARTRHAS